jgi:hypothetical protein
MPDYARYEQLKTQWIKSNPHATPEQFQKAIRKIARECGI